MRVQCCDHIGMNGVDLTKLESFLEAEPSVRFAYVFGSRANDTAGPLSDLDVAVYLSPDLDYFTHRLRLLEKLNRLLGTDAIDLVILNEAPLLLSHRIVRDGYIIKDHREVRVRFEARTLNEYLDMAYLRRAHNNLEAADGR